MKRLFIVVAVIALGLFAAKVYAAESSGPKMVKPDWPLPLAREVDGGTGMPGEQQMDGLERLGLDSPG